MVRGTYIDLPDPDRSQTRPTSSSTFADSAVDMAASTPVEKPQILRAPTSDYFNGMIPFTPLDIDQTLSNKMRQLAAVAWAMEQDEDMTEAKRERLHSMLSGLELFLEASSPTKFQEVVKLEQAQTAQDDPEHADAVIDDSEDVEVDEVDEDRDEWIDESELITVRESLAATVASMRHRQEEQRHLHELTVQKLEAVAQRCLLQEQQAEDLLRDMRQIRKDNDSLQTENDNLRDRVSNLQADASRNEFAVEAMSSAVTGLEGWIETATPQPVTPLPEYKSKRQKVVIRGKGRFRGRYYVDEDGDEAVAYSLADAAPETQELHDGVKAWLRGFRDVQEELRQSPASNRGQSRFHDSRRHEEDDWGDFESPSVIHS